ncbi:hypothetical protein VTL71DRAFT_9284 [Oculimacula yallundae]|uniref:3'-5' exonuclease domain-containing protein n=1 Tax=Oculimacula yallundae TaxID=86028 RepID=A0ABR4BSL7_9HELO
MRNTEKFLERGTGEDITMASQGIEPISPAQQFSSIEAIATVNSAGHEPHDGLGASPIAIKGSPSPSTELPLAGFSGTKNNHITTPVAVFRADESGNAGSTAKQIYELHPDSFAKLTISPSSSQGSIDSKIGSESSTDSGRTGTTTPDHRNPTNDSQAFEYSNSKQTAVNTVKKLVAFLGRIASIVPSTREVPQLALDSEGNNLGRNGTLTLLQLYVRCFDHTYVFDILELGKEVALDTKSADGSSLRGLLESPKHFQVWWDPRNDQDALFHLLGVTLPAGRVLNLALIAVGVIGYERGRGYSHRISLINCIGTEGTAWMTENALKEWLQISWSAKAELQACDYDCFDERPLSAENWGYAADDVNQQLKLYDLLAPQQSQQLRELVGIVTIKELKASLGADKPITGSAAPDEFSVLPHKPMSPPKIWVPDPGEYPSVTTRSAPTPTDDGPDAWEAKHMAAWGLEY